MFYSRLTCFLLRNGSQDDFEDEFDEAMKSTDLGALNQPNEQATESTQDSDDESDEEYTSLQILVRTLSSSFYRVELEF